MDEGNRKCVLKHLHALKLVVVHGDMDERIGTKAGEFEKTTEIHKYNYILLIL